MSPLAATMLSATPIAQFRHAQLHARRRATASAEARAGFELLNPAIVAFIGRQQLHIARAAASHDRTSARARMHRRLVASSARTPLRGASAA